MPEFSRLSHLAVLEWQENEDEQVVGCEIGARRRADKTEILIPEV
jgi:hypothetical protein